MNHEAAGTSRVVVAIGNTHIRAGICRNGNLTGHTAVATGPAQTDRKELGPIVDVIVESRCRRVVVSSVVPTALAALQECIEGQAGVTMVVVGRDIPLPLELDVECPERVGADRVCAAAAGFARAGQACVVVDFGTAITVNAVGDDGVFLGGAILPGLGLGARALSEHTAALPLVEVHRPSCVLGRTTEQALNAGLFYGARGAVRELVEALATEFGRWPTLIFAGGDAALIAQGCDFVDAVIPELGLLGLDLADRQHQESRP